MAAAASPETGPLESGAPERQDSQGRTRIVTASSLFDGHDAAINVMRRILQASGAEVIHLGHHRSVDEVVQTAIQEDADAIAVTSYQGGHIEYLQFAYDMLSQAGCGHIKIFAGGGGTILPAEIELLQDYGIEKIYSPDDGRSMGLQGMIDDLLQRAQRPVDMLLQDWESLTVNALDARLSLRQRSASIARLISAIENNSTVAPKILGAVTSGHDSGPLVLGVTGTGGAGKSSVTDELIRRFGQWHGLRPEVSDTRSTSIAVISVDPSRRRSGGALLGDRIRMNSIYGPQVYMRSIATRQSNVATSAHLPQIIQILKATGSDLIIVETSGIGQSGTEVVDLADLSLYVMTPEYGAASQLEKIDMLDYADLVALNKSDKQGASDALRDVRKQVQRNRGAWDVELESMPVFATVGSRFGDPGIDRLFEALTDRLGAAPGGAGKRAHKLTAELDEAHLTIVPPRRIRYLSEIADDIRGYGRHVAEQQRLANICYGIRQASSVADADLKGRLESLFSEQYESLEQPSRDAIEGWSDLVDSYAADSFEYHVRGREIAVDTSSASLSGTRVPRIALPRFSAWGDIVAWRAQENVPGSFPFTAGVFPFKREGEPPTRMFAGEGGPERTNRRFHYVSEDQPAKRLSTAFDSVTLYGSDPATRPDIYGKIGNAGVNVATLDDAKRLYSGFDLSDPMTSVSMTINGPAAIVLAFYMNAAIDQQCEKFLEEQGQLGRVEEALVARYDSRGFDRPTYAGELPASNDGLGLRLLGLSGSDVVDAESYQKIKGRVLSSIRGTVQADIFKEDQAQNTCIFSTEFALRLMGDIQEFFVENAVRNFYSVSISGYHIAEAGANPITQLAFTLSNGFTYLEYYRHRGMEVDDFIRNFSFFFSNGLDPEYSVIGRVARRIWAKALKLTYGADARAQKLKYHIQTSGRSLHAQEIQFNDIRTTLQALYAIYDNCNSLHTNAYDEAITTPTEESVRRAMAIQLIIDTELGTTKNENPNQGSFLIEELSDLVEDAVLTEFDRITERGGVLGAMETMYQRHKIQEESMLYERLKHSGELPVVGVNTFLADGGSETLAPLAVVRSSDAEKQEQIRRVEASMKLHAGHSERHVKALQAAAVQGDNLFVELLEATKYCTLGQLTNALYDVGGQYRRNA